MNAYIKFGEIRSFSSQDIEQKGNYESGGELPWFDQLAVGVTAWNLLSIRIV